MIIPPIGKRKTSAHQRTLCKTGRLLFKTSTCRALAQIDKLLHMCMMHELTEDDDVENQDDETNDTATCAVLPYISVAGCVDRGGGNEGEEEELDEHLEEDVVEHFERVDLISK